MPIVINTTEQSCASKVTRPSIPLSLQQSLTRFMSIHKGRVCANSQYEDTHYPGNSWSNTLATQDENLAVTITFSVPISRLKNENMLRNLEGIRLKWDTISNTNLMENAGLIMLATQDNLIGLSAMPRLDNHPNDRSVHKFNLRDKFSIYRAKDAVVFMSGNSNTFGNDAQGGSILMTGLTHVMSELNPAKLLKQVPPISCVYRNVYKKENYRYPNILYHFRSINAYAGNSSFYRTLYTFCASLGARLSNLNIGFLEYLESVAHSWGQFILLLENTSFRSGNVIYLISRTTMRRVKFLHVKPPTTVTV